MSVKKTGKHNVESPINIRFEKTLVRYSFLPYKAFSPSVSESSRCAYEGESMYYFLTICTGTKK